MKRTTAGLGTGLMALGSGGIAQPYVAPPTHLEITIDEVRAGHAQMSELAELRLPRYLFEGEDLIPSAITDEGTDSKNNEGDEIAVHVDIDLATKYMFRGATLDNKPVIQTVISASKGDFTTIGFLNYALSTGQITETDFTLEYSTAWKKDLVIASGYTHLDFPNTGFPSTQEVYVGAIFEDALLNPELFAFYDFMDGNGLYAELGISKPFDFSDTSLTAEAKLGYNNSFFRDSNGLSHFEVGASSEKNLTDRLSAHAAIKHSHAMAKEFQDKTWFEFGLGYDF